MRAVALESDVIVFVSDVWQTTCTAVRAGEEGFVIDSPVYPEELRALPDVLAQAGFPVSGLLRHPRRLGSPAGPPGLPGGCTRVRGVNGRGGWPLSPERRSESCAASMPSTTWSVRARWRWGPCSHCRCPASSSSGPHTSSSCTRATVTRATEPPTGCPG